MTERFTGKAGWLIYYWEMSRPGIGHFKTDIMRYAVYFLSLMVLLIWSCQKDDFAVTEEKQGSEIDYRTEDSGGDYTAFSGPAYASLIKNGESGFEAILGGQYYTIADRGRYEDLGILGLYWSSTMFDSETAWFYNFNSRKNKLIRTNNPIDYIDIRYTCRCVQDVKDRTTGSGTIKDPDGNSHQWKIMDDGKKWLVQNLRYDVPGSLTYPSTNPEIYGRLYTWTESKTACQALGSGWKLPGKRDWDGLVEAYGGWDNFQPIINVKFEPKEGITPLTVRVDASTSYDIDGQIVHYEFDFGDGNVKTGMRSNFVYTEPGIHQIWLTITDNDGLTNSTMRKVFVYDAETVAPLAKFTVTPNEGTAPLTVSLNAAASRDDDGEIVSYDYDFDDGNTGSGLTTTHTYTAPGSYRITLTVTDNDGNTGTTVRRVEVQ